MNKIIKTAKECTEKKMSKRRQGREEGVCVCGGGGGSIGNKETKVGLPHLYTIIYNT